MYRLKEEGEILIQVKKALKIMEILSLCKYNMYTCRILNIYIYIICINLLNSMINIM